MKNNSSTDNTDVKITVNKINVADWKDASATQPISSGTKWFAFTAAQDNEYRFVVENTDGYYSSSVYLYTAKQFEAENGGNSINVSSTSYPFDKNETVYLKVNAYGDATLKAEKVEMQAIQSGENKIEIANNSNTTVVKFTAPETGIYTFASDMEGSNKYLYLYADKEAYVNNSSSQSSGYYDSIKQLCYPLIQGTTVYLKLEDYSSSGEEKACVLTISMDEDVEMQEVTLGKETSLSVVSGEQKWIYFKVEDTDQSSYRITGSADSYNNLYCYYASYLTNSNWVNNMYSGGSFAVDSGYDSYAFVYNYGKNQVMYMYIRPNNTGNIKITINEYKN